LRHKNILCLRDVFLDKKFDIYLVTDLLVMDLTRLIADKKLESPYLEYFLFQITTGVKYLHSCGVMHRFASLFFIFSDLKPGNILVNDDCKVQICDLGLARNVESRMTGYVTTRFYRAPEVMLTWQRYDDAVDIWSIGCIFAEMITATVLFPGQDRK
jgi:p38 MAP kinase